MINLLKGFCITDWAPDSFARLLLALGLLLSSIPAMAADPCGLFPDLSVTLQGDFHGTCKSIEMTDCAYHDYRRVRFPRVTEFDQYGTQFHQLTFPQEKHLWAVLSLRMNQSSVACWRGGSVIGRNPLAMTWSTASGSKSRKNNFIQIESGEVQVKDVRLHNLHDAFLMPTSEAKLHVSRSWVSWNRDDFFEGHLKELKITDTLVDGTYNFLSNPDAGCEPHSDNGQPVITIENSLIRLSSMPGPYGGHTERWHMEREGGHHRLWKLDGCSWEQWPKFILRNNIFYIDGPRTSRHKLNDPRCELALPGACGDAELRNITECQNNLFIYAEYGEWHEGSIAPGPVPVPGGRFYNPENPDYMANGLDCYQRITDVDPTHSISRLNALWYQFRQDWIDRMTEEGSAGPAPIAGIDVEAIPLGTLISLKNSGSGQCLTSDTDGVSMSACDDRDEQKFIALAGKESLFSGGLYFTDSEGRWINSDSTEDSKGALSRSDKTAQKPDSVVPWYVMPLQGVDEAYAIETEAFRKSYLRVDNADAIPRFQGFYEEGPGTRVPQLAFDSLSSAYLRWEVMPERNLE